ncbi:MAG: hypothetical protein KF901_33795, partial [Myxococcales bacterium]|nr:hypothetical protein [Myxococcales bacterium]
MRSKTWLLPGLAVLGLLHACTTGGNGGGGGGGPDSRFTFSPRDAARACGHDADCVILPALTDCASCCGDGAVARGEGERAYTSVVEACKSPEAPESVTCAMACGSFRPACHD